MVKFLDTHFGIVDNDGLSEKGNVKKVASDINGGFLLYKLRKSCHGRIE